MEQEKLKILIIDYEVETSKVMINFVQYLKKKGFEVVTAKDGLSGLKQFKNEKPDVVIIEPMLSKVHGFELCKAIKKTKVGEKIPVIILTGIYKSNKYKRTAIKDYLATDYLFKPPDKKQILEIIYNSLPKEKKRIIKKMILARKGKVSPKKSIEEQFKKFLDETLKELQTKKDNKEKLEADKKKDKTKIDRLLEETLAEVVLDTVKKELIYEKEPIERKEKKSEPVLKDETKKIKEVKEPEKIEEAEEIKEEVFEDELEEVEDFEVDRIDQTLKMKPEEEIEEGIVFGKYILLEKIASGGMAELWKAKLKGVKGFEKLVAIKRIHPHFSKDKKFIRMFINEAKLAAQLNHQNIVQIYDLGEVQGWYYIAMEYIFGKDLRAVLKRSKEKNLPMNIPMAVYIAAKIASALDYAHRKKGLDGKPLNIVHRDISPQNVLISYEGEVKLVDFGIAKATTSDSVTKVGALKGKLPYMSPEQASGKPLNNQSDIFSLGTLLYELLTYINPFYDENEIAILDNVRKAKFIPPSRINPNIPEVLERIILKAMEPDLSRRYKSAEDLERDLKHFLFSLKLSPDVYNIADYMRKLFKEEIELEIPELLEKQPEEQEPIEITGEKPDENEEKVKSLEEKVEETKKMVQKEEIKVEDETRTKPMPQKIEEIEEKLPDKTLKFKKAEIEKELAQKWERKKSIGLIGILKSPITIGVITFLIIGIILFYILTNTGGEKITKTSEKRKKVSKKAVILKSPTASNKTLAKNTPTPSPPTATFTPTLSPTPQPTKAKPTNTPTFTPTPTLTPTATSSPTPTLTPTPTPTPPLVKEGDFIENPEIKPVLLHKINPKYPRIAKKIGLQGYVILSLFISEKGDVIDVEVIKDSSKGKGGFAEEAIKAVKKWKYKPAMHKGVKVKTKINVLIPFRLK